MKLNEFDYLAQLPGEGREQDWIRMRLEKQGSPSKPSGAGSMGRGAAAE